MKYIRGVIEMTAEVPDNAEIVTPEDHESYLRIGGLLQCNLRLCP